ncbi:GTP 3',8-cyclase MoaA [Peptostreptococcaceae bacterium OttesenSCG-928-C18]|nr:GTP 3',8-cyclase MoaA [Peptostreptococcaceae bacterium OttesenSCG-928-C18]
MKDNFGRDINYLRISITDKCNLRCKYCMPEDGVLKVEHEDVMTIEEYIKVAKVFKGLGISKVRITGGEPLVKKGVLDLISGLKEIGIEEIAMTTNGILLSKMAKDLKEAGLTRVNISLDSLEEKKYKDITRGGNLQDVFKGIEACKKYGIAPIKINTVVMKDVNIDEFKSFVNLTKDEDLSVRFIELMPIGEAIKYKDKFISNDELLEMYPELMPIDSKDISSPARYYKLPNSKGNIGFINPMSCKFCGTCNRVRLTSKGQLLMCLHSNIHIELLKPLREGKDIEEIIKNSIYNKPETHYLLEGEYNSTDMNKIGG